MTKVCHCLRWKGYKEDAGEDELAWAFLGNHVPYTCLHTGKPWGEDGDVAAPELCHPERGCYERPSSLAARLTRRGSAPERS